MSHQERPTLPKREKEIKPEDKLQVAETALAQTSQTTSNRFSRIMEHVRGLSNEALGALKDLADIKVSRNSALMLVAMELVAINYTKPELADTVHEVAQENGGISGTAADSVVYLADSSRLFIDYVVLGEKDKDSDLAWGKDRPASFQ